MLTIAMGLEDQQGDYLGNINQSILRSCTYTLLDVDSTTNRRLTPVIGLG